MSQPVFEQETAHIEIAEVLNQTQMNNQVAVTTESKEKSIIVIKKGPRNVETSLIGKDEFFKLLALAESLKLPILLEGNPGVGKTNIVLDYVKSMYDFSIEGHREDYLNDGVFMLETDEGTKSSEVKGNVNLKKLVIDHTFEIDSPITRAKGIIINEVDKASSSLRNAFLGIMNERVLFNGNDKIPCKWELFVATCNEIPKEEEKSPFWDRFPLKVKVNRLNVSELLKYYQQGDKNYHSTIRVMIPSSEQIDKVQIATDKLSKFLDVAYKNSTDRTLTSVPRMAKAISLVYNCSIDKALVKACELLAGPELASKLSKTLLSAEKRAVMDKVEMISGMNNEAQIKKAIGEIEHMIGKYYNEGKFVDSDIEELKVLIDLTMQNHPYYKIEIDSEDEDQN